MSGVHSGPFRESRVIDGILFGNPWLKQNPPFWANVTFNNVYNITYVRLMQCMLLGKHGQTENITIEFNDGSQFPVSNDTFLHVWLAGIPHFDMRGTGHYSKIVNFHHTDLSVISNRE